MPWTTFLLAATIQTQVNQVEKPPAVRSRFEFAAPLPSIPPVFLDSYVSGGSIASQTAKALGLQARIMWIDATANIEAYNSAEKIKNLVAKIKDSGFNTIVFDVKPIAGLTVYPSAEAPRLKEWKGKVLPDDLDPLANMVQEAHAQGLSIFASLNAFSEGHNLFGVGPGYAKPDWQSVLYEPVPIVASPLGANYEIRTPFNQLPNEVGALGWFTQAAKMPAPKEGNFAVTLTRQGLVQDGFEGGGIGNGVPTLPPGGSALVGSGGGAAFLRSIAQPGFKIAIKTQARFVRTGERPERQIPLIMNPNHPEVQAYELNIVREVAARYPVDGILFDDRFRYAGLDADFSPLTMRKFETFLKRPVKWPDEVFRFTILPNLSRGILPGPLYDTWIAWRAQQLKNFYARARQVVKTTRPTCQVGIYAGSWYADYPALGTNWAAQDFDAGFWFNTPEYRQAGLASYLDFFVAGCYYTVPTIYDALATNQSLGSTIEASAGLVNRAVRDQTWFYAGIQLNMFRGNVEALRNALQAACATSQGVMVFDLSHDTDSLWPVFQEAFALPAKAPHQMPQALQQVRSLRARLDKTLKREPRLFC